MALQGNGTFLDKLGNIIGEEGLKTELNITFSAETLIKLMITIMMAILLSYMVQSVLRKAIK
tara:strand:+ start:367 stop:552 length:186 start_codon:yes stop_codon:yes gene_type:complete